MSKDGSESYLDSLVIYIVILVIIKMGVERQAAKVNWLTSMAMIVMAGTVFRMGKWMGKINKVKISELQERAGLILKGKPQQLTIVPKPASR